MSETRDLDEQICEVVFGWKVLSGDDIPDSHQTHHRKRVWFARGGSGPAVACEECGDIPEFSTDLSAAMRAYEEFRKQRGWTAWEIRHFADRWYVTLLNGARVQGEASTLAAAMCAALIEAGKRGTTSAALSTSPTAQELAANPKNGERAAKLKGEGGKR